MKIIVAIIDATLGNFLFSKNKGRIIIVPANAIANGYKKPDQKDSFQMSTLPTPRKIHINNIIIQEMRTPCFLRDFLKS